MCIMKKLDVVKHHCCHLSTKRREAILNLLLQYEDLRILNLDDNVTVYPISSTNFYDWDSIFDTIYKSPKVGSI